MRTACSVFAVGNAYQGTVTVRTPKGTLHDVPFQVSQRGAKITWLAPPGAFALVGTDGAVPAATPVRDRPLELVHGPVDPPGAEPAEPLLSTHLD
jgi:hypothetical protein